MWRDLHRELSAHGVSVLTIALEAEPSRALPYLDAAGDELAALIDRTHATGPALGLINVPLAVWIEADGTVVRPAHYCPVSPSPFAGRAVPEGLDPRMAGRIELLASRPDRHLDYLAALRDWAANGPASAWALDPDAVRQAGGRRTADQARAAACFELGESLRRSGDEAAAVPWWREAHRLQPENVAYKRQAWSFVTTAAGATDVDLIQEDTGPYEGNWLDDMIAIGMDRAYPELMPRSA